MAYFKYLGEDHTLVKTTEQGPKQKVVQGEIFETNLPKENFMGRRFIEVDKKWNAIDARNSQFDGVTANSTDLHDKTIKPEEKGEEVETKPEEDDETPANEETSVETQENSTETQEAEKVEETDVKTTISTQKAVSIAKKVKLFEVEDEYVKYLETLTEEEKTNEKVAEAITFMNNVFAEAKN